jgi:hypothetical protein
MEMTVYNPQKGRLETIEVEFTEENTTWFPHCKNADEVSMITDFEGGLLIRKFAYMYPIRIYEKSRADVGCNRKKVMRLLRLYG